MNTSFILSSPQDSCQSKLFSFASAIHQTFPFPRANTCIRVSGFCFRRTRRSPNLRSHQFRVSYKFPKSLFSEEPQLSDVDEDDEEDEEAADEYEVTPLEVLTGVEEEDDALEAIPTATETQFRSAEFKWQRVERLRNEVREFGEEIIDADELASVYDFRVDKFQVNFCSYLVHNYIQF